MTSKLTRERIEQYAKDPRMCNINDEIRELARMALAAMDSEPVYQVYGNNDDTWSDVDEEEMIRCRSIGEDTRTLYSAPPTPVVDSEPVAAVLSSRPGNDTSTIDRALPIGTPLYRHAQQAPETEREPIAWLNDAYLARGVIDGEAGSEDAGPGYIPVYREASPAPVVPDSRVITQHFDTIALETAREIMCDVNRRSDFLGGDTQLLSRIQCRIDNACRAAMLQAGNCREIANSSTNNCREIPETSTRRSREHFISLCNEFWNWQELDDITAVEEEPRLEWDGQVFTHRVTQALWRMYQAAPGNSPVIPEGYRLQPISEYEAMRAIINSDEWPQRWIPVSERMPEVGVKVLCSPVKDEPIHATFNGQLWLQDVSWSGSEEPIDNVIPVSVTHWMPLPAAPQEEKTERKK